MNPTESTPADSGDRATHRSFLTAFVVSSAMLLAAISAMNVVVDPHGAWRTNLLPGGYAGSATRIGKGELLHRFRGSTVLLGNSRTKLGIRPDGPGIVAPPACNLGYSAAVAKEVWMTIDRSVEHPTVESILLFVDYSMFSEAEPKGDFSMSRLHSKRSDFDHYCDLLFNSRTLGNSCEQLVRILVGEPPDYTPDGFAIEEQRPSRTVSQRERSIKILNKALANGGHFEQFHYAPATIESLRDAIRHCRDRSVHLEIAINPTHATLLECLFQLNRWDDYQHWMRDLTRMVDEESRGGIALWDFSGFHSYTSEPIFSEPASEAGRWFWEPSHYKPELGNKMLERIHGLPAADPNFGVRLTSANVEDHLRKIAADRQQWLSSRAPDAQWVAGLIERSGQGRSATRVAAVIAPDAARR